MATVVGRENWDKLPHWVRTPAELFALDVLSRVRVSIPIYDKCLEWLPLDHGSWVAETWLAKRDGETYLRLRLRNGASSPTVEERIAEVRVEYTEADLVEIAHKELVEAYDAKLKAETRIREIEARLRASPTGPTAWDRVLVVDED